MKNQDKIAHTPGPWKIDRLPIQSSGGSNTCYKIGPMAACIYDDWRPRESGISEKQNEANARLIAAAPDLVNALENAPVKRMGVETDAQFIERYKAWYRDLRYEALKKATQ